MHILEDRSLRLDNVTMDDVGEYSCEAENAVGVVVATGLLNVVGKYRRKEVFSLELKY